MKTQILRLEPHDDYISVRDKLGWKQTGRIVLVWPRRGAILQRELDLLLIQRQVRALSGQLALVTRDPVVRFHAQNLGIPVFESAEAAQRTVWRRGRRKLPPRRRRPRPDLDALRDAARPALPRWYTHPLTRVSAFLLGVLAALALVAVFLPSAHITLTPIVRTEANALSVTASPQVEAVEVGGLLPLRTRTITVEGRATRPVSGLVRLPDTPASGHVRFTNLTDHEVSVPRGTPVFAPDFPELRFETTQEGVVPAGVGQTLVLPVRALQGGTASNLPAGSLVALSGGLGAQLTVTNPAALRGGADVTLPAPSSTDRMTLRNDLLEALQESALQEAENAAQAGDILFAATLQLQEIEEETYTPPEGQAGDTLALLLRATFSVQYVAGEDLRTLAEALAHAQQRPNYHLQPDSLRWEHQTQPTLQPDGYARWRVLVSWQQQADLNLEAGRDLAVGATPQAVRTRLQAMLPLAAPPSIELTPAWWPRLPLLPFRITITV
ncbi:MAG: hypothetical protein D6755_09635, partial [Anaerolineae bacterium]